LHANGSKVPDHSLAELCPFGTTSRRCDRLADGWQGVHDSGGTTYSPRPARCIKGARRADSQGMGEVIRKHSVRRAERELTRAAEPSRGLDDAL